MRIPGLFNGWEINWIVVVVVVIIIINNNYNNNNNHHHKYFKIMVEKMITVYLIFILKSLKVNKTLINMMTGINL